MVLLCYIWTENERNQKEKSNKEPRNINIDAYIKLVEK